MKVSRLCAKLCAIALPNMLPDEIKRPAPHVQPGILVMTHLFVCCSRAEFSCSVNGVECKVIVDVATGRRMLNQ